MVAPLVIVFRREGSTLSATTVTAAVAILAACPPTIIVAHAAWDGSVAFRAVGGGVFPVVELPGPAPLRGRLVSSRLPRWPRLGAGRVLPVSVRAGGNTCRDAPWGQAK